MDILDEVNLNSSFLHYSIIRIFYVSDIFHENTAGSNPGVGPVFLQEALTTGR